MCVIKRNFRIDSFLSDNLHEYANYCICAESDIVNVALARLFSCGSAYILDCVDVYKSIDDPEAYIDSLYSEEVH